MSCPCLAAGAVWHFSFGALPAALTASPYFAAHLCCRHCVARFQDCPVCGADIISREPDTELQGAKLLLLVLLKAAFSLSSCVASAPPPSCKPRALLCSVLPQGALHVLCMASVVALTPPVTSQTSHTSDATPPCSSPLRKSGTCAREAGTALYCLTACVEEFAAV